jgi:hypothetical protein
MIYDVEDLGTRRQLPPLLETESAGKATSTLIAPGPISIPS